MSSSRKFREVIEIIKKSPKIKEELLDSLKKMGTPITEERLDKIASYYPLNPNEGESIVKALHSSKYLSSPLQEWLDSVPKYRTNIKSVPSNMVDEISHIGAPEDVLAMESFADPIKLMSTSDKLTFAKHQAKGAWVNRLSIPQLYNKNIRAGYDMCEILSTGSSTPLPSSEKKELFTYPKKPPLLLKNPKISDEERRNLHNYLSKSNKPKEAHTALDEAINRINESHFELYVLNNRTDWIR
ncbi:MAG: hypothetical protein R3D71_04795 [Rickettsiales bacterium]